MRTPTNILLISLYAYFGLYAVLTLLHLTSLPVAWNDETYFLDPAIQFLKTGVYGSRIWPQEGTEKFFFAHMPMISVLHILNLSIFPWDIFFVRLPFVLLFGAGMFFFYRLLHDGFDLNKTWCLFFIFLFINDKASGEALRSVRTESIEVTFMALALWRIYTDKDKRWTSFIVSCMFLTHPKLWAMVMVLLVYLFWIEQNKKVALFNLFIFLLPILAFLTYGKFDFGAIQEQLLTHAEEHGPSSEAGNSIFYNHFVSRFWPFYLTQPYVLLIYGASLFFAIRSILTKRDFKDNVLAWCFVCTNIYWLFKLGPFTRYNAVLMFLSYTLVGKHLWTFLKDEVLTNKKVVFLLLLFPVFSFVFMSRHAAAFIQREERDLGKVTFWLDKHFKDKKDKKILLAHESAAHYYSIVHPWVDFCLVYSVEKFKFEEYDEVYACIWQKIDRADFQFIDEYRLPPVLSDESSTRQMTYNYFKLYKLKTPEALLFLKQETLWRQNPCK